MKKFKQILSYVVVLGYGVSSYGQSNLSGLAEETYRTRISEYFYSKNGSEVLKSVQLMGEVAKPGLYHLPTNTNLTTLLSISGGAIKDADTTKVFVRDVAGNVKEENLYQMIKQGKDISLAGGEIVVIPPKTPFFSADAVNGVTILTGILTALFTGILVSEQLKK